MTTIDTFTVDHHAGSVPLTIAGRHFSFFVPERLEPFMDDGGDVAQFPLWAKIWPASLVLADHLAARPVVPDCRILEIGAGLGVVGVVAAAFGHTITCSEHSPHALAFLKANALANNCPNLSILALDWHRPLPDHRFDLILGSEVVYRETDFDPLERLFRALLRPGGTVILTSEIRKTSLMFYDRLSATYDIKAGQKVLRGQDQQLKVMFCQLQPRQG